MTAFSTMPGPGCARSSLATSRNSCSWLFIRASAVGPVVASTRRMPAATPPSEVILNTPMSPVRATCVPPQNSRELPMSSTRTSSPYFSPNSITAPDFLACSIGITCARVGAFCRISAFTRGSTSRICSLGHRLVVREVEARLLRVDQRALLLHVRAEHLAQRLVHEVGHRVVAHGAGAQHGVRPAPRPCRRPSACRSSACRGGRRRRRWIFCVSATSKVPAGAHQLAAIADLAAGLRRRTASRRAPPCRYRRSSARRRCAPSRYSATTLAGWFSVS